MTEQPHESVHANAQSTEASTATPPRTTSPPLQEYPGHDSALSLTVGGPDSGNAPEDDNAESYNGDDGDDEQTFADNDSAFGGSLIGCDTDTLSSFITDYRYENGRRYHAYRDGEYWVFSRASIVELKC